jgi:D-glycero-D-manno-heptose 1,7-bisphosphate phosphatase
MGIGEIMDRAVFLDRDGVLNYNVINSETGDWESPHKPEDLKLFPWTIKSLQKLQRLEFRLFLVSNQPSYAKGKTSLENIQKIQEAMHTILTSNNILFTEYFYCYHHPQGIMPEVSKNCDCRKPGAKFLVDTQARYQLDMPNSWMIGDRDSDIFCGQKAGTKTIMIRNQEEFNSQKADKSSPDFTVDDLAEAVKIIVNYK